LAKVLARLVVALAFCSSCSLSSAADFEFLAGEDVPVCLAYAESVKTWPTPTGPCIADLPLAAHGIERITGPIQKIQFSLAEDDPTVGLRKHAFDFILRSDSNPANYFYADKLDEWRNTEKQRSIARAGLSARMEGLSPDFSLRFTVADIDNDGVNERILFQPHCVSGGNVISTITMASPLVLNSHGDVVDVERTASILRRPIRNSKARGIRATPDGRPQPLADIISHSAFGLLRFEGKTYFDFRWDASQAALSDPSDFRVVRVFVAAGRVSRAVCAFRLKAD